MDTTTQTTAEEQGTTTKRVRRQRAKGRAHGEGSVYFEQTSGKWVAAVTLGIVNGKRKRKRLRFDTQADARRALTKLAKSLDDGIGAGDDRMTVRAFLERWLAECVEGPMSKLRERTRVVYANPVRKHLMPGLGHHTLAKLSPLHVRAFLSSSLAEKNEDGTPRYAPRTVQYWHALLRSALKQAERWGLVARNVAKLVDPVPLTRKEAASMTTEQAGKLLGHLKSHRLRALFTLAIAMGLRRGEIVGLRWGAHVDLDAGVLRVREQLQRIKGKGLVVVELKTEKSRRTLKIPSLVVEALREHAKTQKAEKLKAGPLWTETGYVFTTQTGGKMDGAEVLKLWHRVLKGAGLPPMPFHATRHTAASFLLAHGADLRTVMGVLGHSQISMTADTYSHMLDELRDGAASKADAALRAVQSAVPR